MMRVDRAVGRRVTPFGVVCAVLLVAATAASAQRLTGTENGEWRYLGGDAGHDALLHLVDQINGCQLRGPRGRVDLAGGQLRPQRRLLSIRATPLYVDGVLYTDVPRPSRQVVAVDPATGETLWAVPRARDRQALSAPRRQAYGKGLAYAEVDGRGVIFVTTSRVLPLGARRRDRPAPRGLGRPRAVWTDSRRLGWTSI